MTVGIWITFVITSLLIIASPGPSVTYLVTTSVTRGKRAAYSVIPGIFIGDLTAMIFSLSGMGIILNTFPAVYEGIKIVGACYLIFLGFMALKRVDNNTETSKKTQGWRQGFLLTFLNPKSIIFFASFMPQFVVNDDLYILEMIVLGVTYLSVGLMSDFTYSFCADKISAFLGSNSKKWVGRIGGIVMIVTTIVILVKS